MEGSISIEPSRASRDLSRCPSARHCDPSDLIFPAAAEIYGDDDDSDDALYGSVYPCF
jgi:hypothetical protein